MDNRLIARVLGLVDVWPNSDSRGQSWTGPRRTAQLHKEHQIRPGCSSRPSVDIKQSEQTGRHSHLVQF